MLSENQRYTCGCQRISEPYFSMQTSCGVLQWSAACNRRTTIPCMQGKMQAARALAACLHAGKIVMQHLPEHYRCHDSCTDASLHCHQAAVVSKWSDLKGAVLLKPDAGPTGHSPFQCSRRAWLTRCTRQLPSSQLHPDVASCSIFHVDRPT